MKQVETGAAEASFWRSGAYLAFSLSMPSSAAAITRRRSATLRRRVGKVGEQRKIKLRVPIGKVMDFEFFNQCICDRLVRQHRRYDDHRARFDRSFHLRAHLRQDAWIERVGHVPIEYAKSQLGGMGNQCEQGDDDQPSGVALPGKQCERALSESTR